MTDISIELRSINNEPQSYQQLISLYREVKDCFVQNINIQLISWFAANMSSALGAILDEVASLNTISIASDKTEITTILQKNSFLAHFGYKTQHDDNHTAIPYLKLRSTESRYFNDYVTNELLAKKELPIMTAKLKRKIAESIYEIFVNAQLHEAPHDTIF
jgi:hypothetical protein